MNSDVANTVAAVSSLATLLIISVTAIAAVLQLRHNRNANDIVVYLRLIDQMVSPVMLEGRKNLSAVAARIREDPEFLARLEDPEFTTEEFVSVGALLRFLEHISVLVTRGGVAEELVLAEYADTFLDMWTQMRPAILRRRLAFGPYTGRAFEHLAMRSKRYIESGQMQRDYDALERDES